MNCFMGYNPLVAKEVKITTWIKEFDGDSPVYPSFPNDGDCFVVFATDEDALTHNALSKKTYTNGDWADAEGGGGGGDLSVATITIVSEGEIGVSVVELYPATAMGDPSAYPTSINVMTDDGHSWFSPDFADGEQITVNAGDTKSLSYIILPQGGVTIMDVQYYSKPTVEGNATVKAITVDVNEYWVAEATGDCTITFPAYR